MAEIELGFRRRIAAMRRLPRRDRIFALRAAREWRSLALKSLQERRATRRRADRALRRLSEPKPQ